MGLNAEFFVFLVAPFLPNADTTFAFDLLAPLGNGQICRRSSGHVPDRAEAKLRLGGTARRRGGMLQGRRDFRVEAGDH
jgi:hypothetical protein